MIYNRRSEHYAYVFGTNSVGLKVCVINPIQTSTLRKNNIRKTKTDKIDTYIIAKALMLQQSHRFVTVDDINLMALKAFGQIRQCFVALVEVLRKNH